MNLIEITEKITVCYVKWKGYQSTTFYKGETNQLVLPLLVSVRGKIFIDLNTKLFVHEYVSNAN